MFEGRANERKINQGSLASQLTTNRNDYHTLLCSSSVLEPSHPLPTNDMDRNRAAISPRQTLKQSQARRPNRIAALLSKACNRSAILAEAHCCGFVGSQSVRVNDPSAGSPTETLLRLLLPLSVAIHKSSYSSCQKPETAAVQIVHRSTQSVGATGGVYKGQGHNRGSGAEAIIDNRSSLPHVRGFQMYR